MKPAARLIEGIEKVIYDMERDVDGPVKYIERLKALIDNKLKFGPEGVLEQSMDDLLKKLGLSLDGKINSNERVALIADAVSKHHDVKLRRDISYLQAAVIRMAGMLLLTQERAADYDEIDRHLKGDV